MPVDGVALVRIDHEVHGTLAKFLQKLQTFQAGIRSFGEDADLPDGDGWPAGVHVGPIRPVWRLFTTSTSPDRIAYNVIINVTAANQVQLRWVFETMEKRLGCHVDGFGG